MADKPIYEELEQRVKELEKESLERKQVEGALRESEERYRSLIHKIQAAVVVHDADTRIIACNSKAQELLGLTEDQMLGKAAIDPDWKFLNADGERMPLKEYPVNQVLANRQPLRDLTAGIYRSSQVDQVWVLVNADPVFDYNGNIQQVIVTFMDITKNKQAEEGLRESQYRYGLIFNGSRDAIFITGADAKFVDVNDAASVLTGYSKSKLIRMSIPDLHEKVDLHAYESYFESIMAGEPVVSEAKILRKDGTKVDTEFSNTRIAISGIPFMHTVARDITDRKRTEELLRESEEKYRGIFDESIAAVYLFDEKKNFLDSNQAGLDLLGYSREELLNMSIPDVDANPIVVLPVHEQLLGGERIINYEHRLNRKDGKVISVLNNSKPITDTNGHVIGMQSTLIDITERKQALETLRESEERLAAFMDSAIDGFILFDSELNYVKLNKSAQEITGVDRKEVTGKNVLDIVPDIKETGRYDKYKKVMKTGVPLVIPDLIPHPKFGNKRLDLKAFKAGDGLGVIFTDITERKQMQEKLQKAHDELDERVKELNCLYGISKIRERPNISFEEMLQEIVDLIPPSWQYPEITCARIIIEDQEYKTKNFKETVWKQTSNIVVHGKRIGILEICYLEEKPESDEGPFLKEERSLINAITERLGRVTEHKQAEEALRDSEERFRMLFEDSPISLWEEDFSDVKKYIDSLRNSGLKDFRAYFENHPEDVDHCLQMVKILAVNRSTLDMYQAENNEEFLSSLEKVFTKESYDLFREELIAIAEGRKTFESEGITQTLKGERKHISLRWSVAPGHEETLSRILVSIIDITDRKRSEESLQKAHDELEQRVEERTKDLEIKTTRLEEINAAMKVLLEHSEMYKKELEEKVLSNIKELVDPYLEKLEGGTSDIRKIYLNIIKSNIDEIISPFTRKLSSKYLNLTPSEIRIANLVKQGKTSKEIAGILNVSGKTVGFHRESIRKKLGLKNQKANLRTHLLSLQ